MSDTKLLGWTLGQWSTVAKVYPFDEELLELCDFIDVRRRWLQNNLDSPSECEQIDPLIEFGASHILGSVYLVPDENVTALDAMHKKVTTQPMVNRSSFMGLMF